ncbi:MAG: TraB/GumN family protein [Bacteroidia bacterium]|nr:TraB/GumN family protein [Bacteroidia bacterium]
MKKILVLFSVTALFLSFSENVLVAQTLTKKYQSLLWEVTSPQNPDKKSYLYGTMHVSSKLAFNLSDTFFLGLKNADIIALESNPTDWLDEILNLKYAPEYFGSYPANTYTDKGFYQRIFPIDPPTNSFIGSNIASRDMMLNSLQFRSDPYMSDFEEDTYLDMFIYMAGAKTGRKVVGLENIKHTNDLLRIAQTERKNRKDEKPIPLWLEERMKTQDISEIFEDAYRQQDLDLVLELQDLFSTPHYIQWFLNERNRLMADSMFVLMKNHSVFTGVGAAHLGGDYGVIEYLRKKGCVVRPVSFIKTDFATDTKKYYDSLKTDLILTPQVSPDKQFTINLPAKLYELPYSGTNFLCSEMTNGSFFSVNKIATFGIVSEISADNYLDKIDSLLFENIPGKILSKRRIKNGDYTGIEVKNRTKTGNLQHYQIYVTPFEIIILKMGGNGDFISQWSDSVFASLKFVEDNRKAKWGRIKFIYGGFSVEMPAMHVLDSDLPISAVYTNPVFQGYDSKTKSLFFLTRNSLMDFNYIEEDQFELERTAQKLAKKHEKELGEKSLSRWQGLPCLDFALIPKKGEKGETTYFRMVISGGYYYLLAAKTHKNKKLAKRFFDSFTIEPLSNLKPFEKFTDTLLYFSTLTSKDINESSKRNLGYYDYRKDYEEYSNVNIYLSEAGERVRVFFEKFHEYTFYPDADSLFNETVRNINSEDAFTVFSQKRYEKDGQHIMDLYLSDTGSCRLIKMRAIIKKGGDAIYILRTLVDSVNQGSPFINAFYDNFTPIDSSFGFSVFEEKGNLFLDDLLSTDSTRFKKAISSLDYVTLSKSNIDRVIEVVNTYPFKAKEQEFVQQILLNKLSELEDDKLIDFAKKLYLEHPNNYPIQISALQVLCAQKSMKTIEALKEIMKEDLPYVMDADRVVLAPLRIDSMSLWSHLYPLLFDYEHIQEYKTMIFGDLSNMLDSGIVDGKFYQSFLPKLIAESEFVLKKYLAAEQKNNIAKAKNEAMDESTNNTSTTSYNFSLIQKYKLLLPQIQHKEVAELVKSYDTSITSEVNQIMMIRYRLANKLEVNQGLIDKIAAKPTFLLRLYTNLEDINRLDLIPAKYMDEELLARITLGGSSYVISKFDLEKDTFKLLSSENATIRGKQYRIFYYEINRYISAKQTESRNFDPKDFKNLALVAVELKNGKICPTGSTFNTSVVIDNPERRAKYLEELSEEFQVKDRQRASATDDNSFSYYW